MTSALNSDAPGRAIGLFARGLAMGAADIVPGVSGGTVALMTGIYDRLIRSIVAIDKDCLALLLSGRVRAVWHRVDGAFLLPLLLGILTAIFTLASTIHWLLDAYPQPLWAFFSGLILASGLLLLRDEVVLNRVDRVACFSLGVALAVTIAYLPTVSLLSGLSGLFVAGAIAICAMILPGISGSFMLVLMGMYAPVLAAVRQIALTELMVFAAGCVTGLVSFSKLLDKLLRSHRMSAMAFLCGVLMGSLVAVWPWRVSVATATSGESAALTRPVMPVDIAVPQIALCVATFFAGCLLVWSVQAIAARRST